MRSMRRFGLSAAVLFSLAGSGSALALPRPDGTVEPSSAEVISGWQSPYRAHITALSQPFFEGRAPGLRGNALAAEYVEFELKRAGLQPAVPGEDGSRSFRQTFQFGSTQVIREQAAAFSTAGAQAALTPGTDFNVLAFSGNGTVTAPVVFVGYGIEAGENGYSSFAQDTSLEGKIALILRFEPMDDAGKSRWGEGAWSMRAALEPKIRAAFARKAAGVILVNPPGADDPRVSRLETIDSVGAQQQGAGPVVMLSIDAADRLVKAGDPQGRSLQDLRKLADEGTTLIELSNAPASLTASIERKPTMTDNVIGLLPGAGTLADQHIVIGAHYDHVGYGTFGSRDPQGRGKLHPGADDNASGTSAMIMLAHLLSDAYAQMPPDAPRRSILFMGFTAEESGLNGSRHYVRNPIVPKEAHSLMINLDMVGRLREGRLEVGGVGTATGFEEWLKPYWDSSGLNVAARRGGSGPSDHASFNAAQIPVLFFFTGLHDDYHMPADIAPLINVEGATQIIELVRRVTLGAATRPEPFVYADTGGQPGAAEGPAPGPTRSRVRFGIAPGDYSGDIKGVAVGEVSEGTSAAEAGLKTGDIMTSWNGKPITSVEDWMPLLADAKPGDEVEIEYVRDGQTLKTKAVLKARQQRNQ